MTVIETKKWTNGIKLTCGEISKNIDKYKLLHFLDPKCKSDGIIPFRADGRDSLYWVGVQHPRKILYVFNYCNLNESVDAYEMD